MAWSLLAHDKAAGQTDATVTVATTGANLLIVTIGDYAGGAAATLSDLVGGNSNTWTPFTAQSSGNSRSHLFWCVPSFVGASHAFKSNGNTFASIEVQAWSGAHASPGDQNSGTGYIMVGGDEHASAGSITPTADGALLVSSISFDTALATVSIDAGFTISDNSGFVNAVNEGAALAYFVQTTAAAINPIWTFDVPASGGVCLASFKVAGGTNLSAFVGEPPTGSSLISQ